MSNIKLIPCTHADIPQLQNVAIRAYNDHYLYLWHDGGAWYINQSFSRQALAAELADPNAAFFLIYYAQEKPAGFLKLNIDKALDGYSEEECLELERIYLLRSASGKGIGRQVIAFTGMYARERNKKFIWLKVMDSSAAALRFYEQNGFEKCGTYTLDFRVMKEKYRGMYVMKRAL